MPHLTIKHFPRDVGDQQRKQLAEELTALVVRHFEVPESAVSIALEQVDQSSWNDAVIVPEIIEREHLLIKAPNT
ncbi:tautomerase PptA [Streptomyces sp. BRA346]|uniref:tautomerase PptA n=1 Tax=Streptomyces sp. BRA346 TaxID=2878199 RepID=UPI00406420C7